MNPQFFSPYLLSVLRVMTGLLLLQHPTAKFFKIPHVAMFDNLQLFSLSGVAGMIELVGGIWGYSRGRWLSYSPVNWPLPISSDTRRAVSSR